MIVVDVGCATWGQDNSVEKLIERFHPTTLYGFDPNVGGGVQTLSGTCYIHERAAAWTSNGMLRFEMNGSGSRVVLPADSAVSVPCFRLASWIIAKNERCVLKLDCEGAEYELIPDLASQGAFEFVDLLLVEFHGDELRPPIPVPWEPWV